MARYDFGGTLADFVVTKRHFGNIDVLGLSAANLTFWSLQSGGTQYTDLQFNGSAATAISVGADGQVPTFQGPDGVTLMWADGGSVRVRMAAQGIPGPAGPVASQADLAAALAAAPTVASAAASAASSAVSTAMSSAGAVHGATTLPDAYSDVAFAVTDLSGRRSWLEVDRLTGGPTARVQTILNTLSRAAGVSSIEGAAPEKISTETSGYAFVITDRSNRIGFGVRTDGTVTGTIDKAKALVTPAAASVPFETNNIVLEILGTSPTRTIRYSDSTTGHVATITGGDNYDARVLRDPADISKAVVAYTNTTGATTTRQYRRVSDGATFPASSDPLSYAMWGDSLTNRAGIVNALAAKMTDATVVELGAEGQTSTEIVARQGGLTAVTTGAVTIPASGGVVVPLSIALAWHDDTQNNGSLAGVPGLLTSAEDRTHTFTRTTSGSTVNVPSGTPWVSAKATQYESASVILFVGRNDISGGLGAETIIPNVKLAVARLRPLFRRFLVLSVTTATSETTGTSGYTRIADTNAQLAALYGERFVDIRRWLVDNAAALIAAQGLTKTAADDTAIAGDTIPPSLMNLNAGVPDNIHFSNATQTAIGNYIFDHSITTLGWHA